MERFSGESPTEPDVVLLVHGTGSKPVEEYSDAFRKRGFVWWQPRSDFARWLTTELSSITPAPLLEELIWDGGNSHRDRQAGATKLRHRLRALRSEGRACHIVAHSHGGTLVNLALHDADEFGEDVSHVRSWTTVGTPFFRMRRTSPIGGFRMAFGSLIGLFFIVALALVATSVFLGEYGPDIALVMLTFYVASMMLLVVIYSVPIWLLQKWSDWGDQSHVQRELRVCVRHGGNWLGLWHPLDEAINALSIEKISRPSFIERIRSCRDDQFAAHKLERNRQGHPESISENLWNWVFRRCNLFRILHVAITAFTTVIAAPIAESIVRSRLLRIARGRDVVGVSLSGARTVPGGILPTESCPPLPMEAQVEVEECAHRADPKLTSEMRHLVRKLTFDNADTKLAWAAYGFGDLFHTRYFDSDAVRKLIVAHIRQSSSGVAAYELSSESKAWVRNFEQWRAAWLSRCSRASHRS